MKRVRNLYPKIISRGNIARAIATVNKTHKYCYHHRLNKTVLYIEEHMDETIDKIIDIIESGYEPEQPHIRRRYDKSACKYRDIAEPKIFPDQYIHHAVIQVLEPILLKKLDHYCCASIKGRGIMYGVKAIKHWVRIDTYGTRYGAELDIHHFYDSLQPAVVVDRFRKIIKDYRTLDLISRILTHGVLIGAYTSQWFANIVLQPLDELCRKHFGCKRYLRYMDNLNIFSNNSGDLHLLIAKIKTWLSEFNLKLKSNYQVFQIDKRPLSALGYRFNHKCVRLKKRNQLRLKRQLSRVQKMINNKIKIVWSVAAGTISRIGQLKHCRHTRFFEAYLAPKRQQLLKNIIRTSMKEEIVKWNTSMVSMVTSSC